MKTPTLKRSQISWINFVIVILVLAFFIDYIPDGKLDMLAYLLHFIHSSHLFSTVDNIALISIFKFSLLPNYYFIAATKILSYRALIMVAYFVLLVLYSTDKYVLAMICSFVAHIPLLSYFKQHCLVVRAFQKIS